MSNSLAIGAVTATLRDILSKVSQPLPFDPDPDPDLNDATCTTKPPDKARQNESSNQLNLFLYQTALNGALRNADIARQMRPNETAMTPVALTLFYLVTAYGRNFDDVLGHRLLGRAMSLLHDRAVLLPGDIDKALKGNDLGKQIERVRVTPHAMSNEELSKLWAVFQTPYRISAAYEVSVVLIDSARAAKAAPPVVSRGVGALGAPVPPFAELLRIELPLALQPASRLPSPSPPASLPGDTLTLHGHDLAGTAVAVLFERSLLATPVTRVPLAGATATALGVDLPGDQTVMPAGAYLVSVRVSASANPDQDRTTGSLPLAIAPRIRTITTAPRQPSGVPVTVRVSPQVWPEQRAALLVGDVEVAARPHPMKTDTLQFVVPLPAKTYLARVRVDGVDSFLVDYGASPPAYDPTQVVVLP